MNFAQILVQNRVATALASLPQSVQAQGVTVQKKSTSILLFVTLSSPDSRYDILYLANYGTIHLKDELSRLPGVGNVNVFGAGQYAMRIWLDPNKLQARSLTTTDVIAALQAQNRQVTAGQLGMPPAGAGQAFQYTLMSRAASTMSLNSAVSSSKPAATARSRGCATSAASNSAPRPMGRPSRSTSIRPPASRSTNCRGANALSVEKAVKAKMKELAKRFPPGLVFDIPFDTTTFVDASIHEVYKTLYEAAILVLIVILVFLQDWRAMLVPATTVPVTIIGAFAAMAALGFSVNLSTLFAIILAIGIVVDDAIVVVEGAAHYIEQGLSAAMTRRSARWTQLLGPIIGITLVLMSVFLPSAFLPGLTGRMYSQFALVIAATALISAVNAATLKPTQCALWLRAPVPPEQRNFFYRGFNAVYGRIEAAYAGAHRRDGPPSSHAMVAIALLIIAACRLRHVAAFRPASCRSRIRAMSSSPCSYPTARRSSERSA